MIVTKNKLFQNYFLINIIYIALAGILFPYKSIISYIVGGGFAVLALMWNVIYVKNKSDYSTIYLYSLYVLFLLAFSSDFEYSLKIYLKVFTSIWLFPVSIYLIKDYNALNLFTKKTFPLVGIYLLNFILMNILGIGLKGYGDAVTTGNLFTEGLNTISYVIVLTPLIILFNKKRENNKYIFLTIVILLITQIVTLKRISIVASTLGLLLYLIFSRDRAKYLVNIVIVMVFIAIAFPIFEDVLEQQMINRDSQLVVGNLEQEARYKEYLEVNRKIFSFNDISISLFGEEVFNSQGIYGDNAIFGPDRQIHNDFSRILHDTGIIGFIFYFVLQIKILILFISYFKKSYQYVDSKLLYTLRGVFLSVFILGFIFMFSGGIDGTLFQAYRYVLLGGIVGYFKNKQIENI